MSDCIQEVSSGSNGKASRDLPPSSSYSGSKVSETPVLPRVALGEPAAVKDCLDRYGNLVWSLARRSCPDAQAAEDAVQDIFLKLWTVADRFNPEIASETTFVAMIARRRLIDLSRKRSWPKSSGIELDHFQTTEKDAASRMEVVDEAAKAAKMLETLPLAQQNVIKLSVYEGLSHSKIAERTGLSLGTVKTHLRRGMIKLRKALFPSEEFHVSPQLLKGEPS
ncbi:MAG: sigma-70 family RNA polymerase sigma factor [Planctomycetota bacterium]